MPLHFWYSQEIHPSNDADSGLQSGAPKAQKFTALSKHDASGRDSKKSKFQQNMRLLGGCILSTASLKTKHRA